MILNTKQIIMDSNDNTPIFGHSIEEMQRKMDEVTNLETRRFDYDSRTHKSEIEHSFYVECSLFFQVTFREKETVMLDDWDVAPSADALDQISNIISSTLDKCSDLQIEFTQVASGPRWWNGSELTEVERTSEEVAIWDAENDLSQ